MGRTQFLTTKTAGQKTEQKVSFSSFIGSHHEGQPLVDFLSKRFTYFDKKRWQDTIQAGDILLNGQMATGEEMLVNGDEVRYLAMTRPEPKVPMVIPVLFEDEDLLVVNKPPHLPVHPGGPLSASTR